MREQWELYSTDVWGTQVTDRTIVVMHVDLAFQRQASLFKEGVRAVNLWKLQRSSGTGMTMDTPYYLRISPYPKSTQRTSVIF